MTKYVLIKSKQVTKCSFLPACGTIFVYTVYLIGISDTVSDIATKTLLQKLKVHSMINCPKEFESHVSSTFCVMHVLKLKQFPRMYELIYFLVLLQARNFAVVEIQNFSP